MQNYIFFMNYTNFYRLFFKTMKILLCGGTQKKEMSSVNMEFGKLTHLYTNKN